MAGLEMLSPVWKQACHAKYESYLLLLTMHTNTHQLAPMLAAFVCFFFCIEAMQMNYRTQSIGCLGGEIRATNLHPCQTKDLG